MSETLIRDISRMELMIGIDSVALERHSIGARFSDLTGYFFNRFSANLKSAFKDFSRAEITDYQKRYGRQINLSVKDPLLDLSKIIVPIPKGMQSTYIETYHLLRDILQLVRTDTLESDVALICTAMTGSGHEDVPKFIYEKSMYTKDLAKIGNAYNKKGLTHITANHAFGEVSEIPTLVEGIVAIAETYYPIAIHVQTLVEKASQIHNGVTIPEEQKQQWQTVLLEMGYRISVFATALDHFQDLEHSFIKALDIIRRTSHRH